jgi:LysM domain
MSSMHVAEPGWRITTPQGRATKGKADPAAPRRLAVVVPMPRRPGPAPAAAPVTRAEPARARRPGGPMTGAARHVGSGAGSRPTITPASAGRRPAARAPASAGRRAAAPLRLTRRGRVVLAAAMLLAALAVMTLLAVGSAGGAPLSGRQSAAAGYRGMTRIVVRPGQSLWSIAAVADPSADPRIVIQEIISANALSGTSIQAGQLLWVPKPSS